MTKVIAWGQRINRPRYPQPPGNSLPLIDAAYALGYDGVELDVQLSKDGVAVLMHNHTLDETTDRQGSVRHLTANELRSVRLKDRFGGPPCYVETLESAMRVNAERGPLMVDSYHTTPDTISALLSAIDGAAFDPNLLLLLSYSPGGAEMLKAAVPQATVLLKGAAGSVPPMLDFVQSAVGRADGVAVQSAAYPDLSSAYRRATREAGLKLGVYMHNTDTAALGHLMEIGADFVTSEAPECFAELRQTASN